MPEGPEVKTIAKTLAHEIIGKKFGQLWHSHYRLRRTIDYSLLSRCNGMTIDGVSSYGKILFINADQKPALVVQLGMTGQLTVTHIDALVAPHTHIRWPLQSTHKELRYVDPRRFGLFDSCDDKRKKAIIKKLGPDPFFMTKNEYAPLIKAMKRSSRAIKEVLLNQTVIAGVGNIYASEALFLAGIDPQRQASDINDNEYSVLIERVSEILAQAYQNCGTTFSNYVDGFGKKGAHLPFLKVFQKNGHPCPICASPIQRIKQSGRSTFFCEQCQK
jgi:formamidopyrimidine-DNA glycosylase